MKRKVFIRYFAIVFGVILLAFGFLVAVTLRSASDYVIRIRSERLNNEARDVAETITGLMVVGKTGLEDLVSEQEALERTTLRSRAERVRMTLFITDEKGVVLATSDATAAPPGRQMAESVFNVGLQKARLEESFNSDLGGFLDKPAAVSAILMEQTGDTSGRSHILAVVFAVEKDAGAEDFFSRLLQGFLAATALVVLFTMTAFLYTGSVLNRPVQLLSEAAERYAKGDFSVKLPEEGNGELDALMVTFNDMAQSMEENEQRRQIFVANVSHDLRTPMTTIGGYVQNILEGTIPPEKQKKYLTIILDEVNRLSRMVETLLETSRLTAGAAQYEKAPMDLCELGRVTLLSFERRLEELSADVSFDAEPWRIKVLADEDAIHQVIYNLIDNAVKFTPEHGELAIRVREQGDKAVFAVRNSGKGIPAEELPNIFDRFYKSDRSRGLDKKGFGLGLFIARSIINAHGEEIWVTSQEGAWTEFVFTLPLTK